MAISRQKPGRTSRLQSNPEVTAIVAAALRNGAHRPAAARLAGVTDSAFKSWMAKGSDGSHPLYGPFFRAVTEAEGLRLQTAAAKLIAGLEKPKSKVRTRVFYTDVPQRDAAGNFLCDAGGRAILIRVPNYYVVTETTVDSNDPHRALASLNRRFRERRFDQPSRRRSHGPKRRPVVTQPQPFTLTGPDLDTATEPWEPDYKEDNKVFKNAANKGKKVSYKRPLNRPEARPVPNLSAMPPSPDCGGRLSATFATDSSSFAIPGAAYWQMRVACSQDRSIRGGLTSL